MKATNGERLMTTPKDFDIEYAKLIARQFPIYGSQGKVIDYSNINEYQLELLALHEEYGEEVNPQKKLIIFNRLANMDEETYNKTKNSKSAHESGRTFSNQGKRRGGPRKAEFGPNVGREGGNPQYKKNVIQLEQERIEKEKQELMMKRKRNSNYIQNCIKNGN